MVINKLRLISAWVANKFTVFHSYPASYVFDNSSVQLSLRAPQLILGGQTHCPLVEAQLKSEQIPFMGSPQGS